MLSGPQHSRSLALDLLASLTVAKALDVLTPGSTAMSSLETVSAGAARVNTESPEDRSTTVVLDRRIVAAGVPTREVSDSVLDLPLLPWTPM